MKVPIAEDLERIRKKGYAIERKGFSILVAPKSLTHETADLVTFGKEINIDAELFEMIEQRALR